MFVRLRFLRTGAAMLVLLPALFAQAQLCTPLEDAILAVNEGRYDDALELLRPLAEGGDADAQNVLGGLYMQGWGVAQDVAEARRWYEQSAAQDNPLALYNLGGMYANGIGVERDCGRALALVHRPAEAGDPVGQVNLGALYADGGPCIAQDYSEAVRWFSAAAGQGDPLGQHSLGAMYANGTGVPQDYSAAMSWYRKAALQGYAGSQAILGWMYEFGQGVDPDPGQAAHWYRLAAEQGDTRAALRLQAVESGATGAGDSLVAAYLETPAEALALEHARVTLVLNLLDIATTLHFGDLVVTDENREQTQSEFANLRVAIEEAMRRRGAVDFGGRYSASATKACKRIPAMWAAGVAERKLGSPEIRQSGNEFTMLQSLRGDERMPLEMTGTVVEDVLVFADFMNSDFIFVGHGDDREIVFAPGSDYILASWPDWVPAPKRGDLDACRVTLERE